MEKMSPDYQEARTTFSAMSKPINEMDIVQEIGDKSFNPMTGTLYPQSYARALTDDTAKSVTGMSNATLENTISPEVMAFKVAITSGMRRTMCGAISFAM